MFSKSEWQVFPMPASSGL